MAYLSFPSLKDPRATRHTAEIIAGLPAEEFAAWRDTRWQRRGADRLRHKMFPTAVMPGLYLAGADTMCVWASPAR